MRTFLILFVACFAAHVSASEEKCRGDDYNGPPLTHGCDYINKNGKCEYCIDDNVCNLKCSEDDLDGGQCKAQGSTRKCECYKTFRADKQAKPGYLKRVDTNNVEDN